MPVLTKEQEELVASIEQGRNCDFGPNESAPLTGLIRSLARMIDVIREDEPRKDKEWRAMMALLEDRGKQILELVARVEGAEWEHKEALECVVCRYEEVGDHSERRQGVSLGIYHVCKRALASRPAKDEK